MSTERRSPCSRSVTNLLGMLCFRNTCRISPPPNRSPSVISNAINIQLRELEIACEPPLNTMLRTSWANLEHVSGPSAYIPDLIKGIESVADIVREQIQQKKYLRNFYDKAVRYV